MFTFIMVIGYLNILLHLFVHALMFMRILDAETSLLRNLKERDIVSRAVQVVPEYLIVCPIRRLRINSMICQTHVLGVLGLV